MSQVNNFLFGSSCECTNMADCLCFLSTKNDVISNYPCQTCNGTGHIEAEEHPMLNWEELLTDEGKKIFKEAVSSEYHKLAIKKIKGILCQSSKPCCDNCKKCNK